MVYVVIPISHQVQGAVFLVGHGPSGLFFGMFICPGSGGHVSSGTCYRKRGTDFSLDRSSRVCRGVKECVGFDKRRSCLYVFSVYRVSFECVEVYLSV